MVKKAIFMLAGCGLCAASAWADLSPSWAGEDNTVHAEFYGFNGIAFGGSSTAADVYTVKDYNGNVLAGVPGQDAPDMTTLGSTVYWEDAGDRWLETTVDWDLSIWMPAISGYETQAFQIQISYWDNQTNAAWRQNYQLGIQPYLSGAGSSAVQGGVISLGSEHDVLSGIITEAFSFTVVNAADGMFIDLAASPSLSVSNPSLITGVTVDSISYAAIPEPSSIALMLVGGACFRWFKRKRLN
jgi:hypothetical protein